MTAPEYVAALLDGYLPVFTLTCGLVAFCAGFNLTRSA